MIEAAGGIPQDGEGDRGAVPPIGTRDQRR
jgi:hypothetical protein